MRAGRSISAAIAAGYKKGFATIIDANIVTLLVAFILFILATAGVKGFAFMLGIGTHRVAVHRGARDAGDPAHAARHARCCSSRRALGAGKQRKHRSRSTSWARRSGSSRCPA